MSTLDPERRELRTNEKTSDPEENITSQSAVLKPAEQTSNEKQPPINDKPLLRKIDLKLVPWVSLLYLISFLDRANIGNAKIEGLQEDLHLSDNQYNNCLTIFFVSYSIFEPVTNVLLKRFHPSIFIPIIMILWGICMTSMGLVHNYSGLLTARWFLGLAEAGLFPGVSYMLSCWYKRSEVGIRLAVFFSAAAVAGSFGGLLAVGISKMAGVGGKPGWAWIFILEGLATILVGIASFWMVPDFPREATFLSEKEKSRVIERLAEDQQGSAKHEDFKMAYFWESLKDWKTYTSAMIYMGTDGALFSFALFLPTIILELGYKSTTAQLLSVPPYVAAALMTIFIGYIADRTRKRGLCNIFVSLLGIIGFSMLLGSQNGSVKYAATFLAAMGIYPPIANTISWVSNNTEGVYKRGISLGFVIGWGNLNGIVSANIYRGHDKPRFITGHSVVLAYLVVLLFGGSVLQHVLLRLENARRLSGKRNAWFELDSEKAKIRGDKRPDFIYTT
ncbi:hypothetical protein PRK78_005759 [Emydomyces testavorans]|uniref:Major facilitator superfamily (MFS) profile domain-containing protein n=1 Tax=Emydomyces testavorans TaxID=2070801 RepID=A0AAF0DL63_9EURO|nr:hypothetical protein PRK78_005759 [Emydomyces testavorans]